ncbi:hypothetical protein C8R47DRAFT_1172974 [Mycena vitilis]|nr:hypothetical protein C8R47DRAFT_1172974 [Mycena vitilis]
MTSTDLMSAVSGMFRALDLIREHGSGGLVNKIIIDQDSLKAFINELSPGAYSSLTKVDFKTLDELLIKPAGLYGSKSEIVAFLSALGAVDELTYVVSLVPFWMDVDSTSARALCLSQDNAVGPALRSGLYLLRSFGLEPGKEQVFVIYWPEDTTWDDNTSPFVSRNRETFMRYLTKMCDQVTCLISEEHAQSIIWSDESEDAATNQGNKKPSRLYKFKVAKTNEQEETVTPRPGFKISAPVLASCHDDHQNSIDPADLEPKFIGGESTQAFLTTNYVPAGQRYTPLELDISALFTCSQERRDDSVELGSELPDEAIETLISVSPALETQYRTAFKSWKARNANSKSTITERRETEDKDKLHQITTDTAAKLPGVYKQALIDRLLDHFPTDIFDQDYSAGDPIQRLRTGTPAATGYDVDLYLPSDQFANLNVHRSIKNELDAILRTHGADAVKPEKEYKILKDNLTYITVFRATRPDLPKKDIVELCKNRSSLISSQAASRTSTSLLSSFSLYASRFNPFASNSEEQELCIRSEAQHRVTTMRDAEFLASLPEMQGIAPALDDIITRATKIVTDHLKSLVDKLLRLFEAKIIQVQYDAFKAELGRNMAKRLADSRRDSLRKLRDDMEKKTPWCESMHLNPERHTQVVLSYKVQGSQRFNSPAHLLCRIHSLSLTTEENHMLQMDQDRTYVPSPQMMPNQASFYLDPDHRVTHAQLIETGDLLLVLESPTHLLICLEKLNHLGSNNYTALRHRKSIHKEKIGAKPIIAYDESTHTLLICATSKSTLHLYLVDEKHSSINSTGSVNLTGSYRAGVTIVQACFVSGREEILVIDSANTARIYSLLPQQFRPATLYLAQPPISVWPSPDGACLLLSYSGGSGLSFRAYHWDTFGSPESHGIDLGFLQVPPHSLSLTSLVNRRNVHLIGINDGVCGSVALDITKKTTEFMFTETAKKSATKARHDLITHNSLINCHSDVWARFPVVAAVQRQTIISSKNRLPRSFTFSTYLDYARFSPHFDDLINTFEQQARKPTGNQLKKIDIRTVHINELLTFLSTDTRWAISEFRAGEWLVDLLCLIPIQIAVTQENRFVPLKDGIVSAELEEKLLGAEVGQIVDSISIGWYESVFQSYMVSKPVQVVSSMGEQSVGKSFCLNHLVDTSFAGSAMRTTEGVWMSVTPTDKALIVALDFEGVHSIERSAQEDTLLVLFNTAISNLVLFRNNFALSRSVQGLFQSFQSSSKVLDPAVNPQLFKSTLVIIIKDVVDSDEEGITIVQAEQDANFISRLHAGQLDIIPWPVIESKQFYALFPTLKKTLDQQEVTHPTAGEFLHTLKTLMAKLKANDWGALSETLAAHRAQKLCTYLNSALYLPSPWSDRKLLSAHIQNFDTDAPIDQPDTLSRFLLSKSDATPEEQQDILRTLQMSWDQFGVRQRMSEDQWIGGLSHFLLDRAEMRIEHVFHWIGSNLARFKSNNANMDLLRRDFDSGAVDLRSNVEICRMQCASCNLLCILGRRHGTDTAHDCQTSHKCLYPCDFLDQHTELETYVRSCHSSAHCLTSSRCVVGVHLCGEPCVLEDKNGCMKSCTKEAKHSDEDHMCAARVHACGEVIYILNLSMQCPNISHEPHDQHVCGTTSCPITCELCSRLCSNSDHLHGLQPNARHLCGQEHKCSALCSAQGICQIDTTPQSIEATFTGRHETFTYTKVHAKRLLCAIVIPANEREHRGPHVHDPKDPNPFHFCETRCINCGYFCTLPLGHPQQEHETSHGSMSKTTWSIDGPDDTILELKGRKFASNDDGAPMMCNLVCQDMGRHIHVDYCRARATEDAPCEGAEIEHIDIPMNPNPDQPKDWISHSLFWRRADPYSREDQANFAKCDSMCPGPEHTATNPPAPSYCSLPILHPIQAAGQPTRTDPDAQGYVSADGHLYSCINPAEMDPSYHVSGSMSDTDRRPLPNRPGADLIIRQCNNRLGAVFSSLHAFWLSRSAATNPGRRGVVARRDAYSVIFFDYDASICLQNDSTSTPNELLHSVLRYSADGGTNFSAALQAAEGTMRDHWDDSRAPVVIFLSDGRDHVADETVCHLSRAALTLGHPLSFHSVLFGNNYGRAILTRMADLALNIQNAAPNNAAQGSVPSSFSEALDEVRLAETFLGFAESLRKPRGSLLR